MRFIISLILFLHIVLSSSAQDIEQLTKADPVAWSGGLTWSNIFTWPKDSASQVTTYSYYISGSLNTTIFGVVCVPINFAYTNNTLSSTVTYPFNRFALTPSYKWVKLHIGYSQMTFSTYTMAGHDFLGGGVELTPIYVLEQFGKDLTNSEVSDLSQIKWIFDGKKVTQEQLTEVMSKIIGEWNVPTKIKDKWIKGNMTEETFKNKLTDIFRAE